jgi:hypothetical protein
MDFKTQDPIISQLLSQTQVSDSLESYTYVPFGELEFIPLGSHVKFIDRNENIKSGGFLIKTSIKPDRTKTYIILKSNLMYKLYPYYYWIFFKPIIHESKVSKAIKTYGLKLLEDELPKPSGTDTSTTTMSIVIKSKPIKTKTKTKDLNKEKQENEEILVQEQDINQVSKPASTSKTKSTSKSSIFKELL